MSNRALHPLKKIGYLLFLLPTLVLAGVVAAAARTGAWNAWSYAPLLVVFGLIPVLDALVGRDAVNPTPAEETELRADRFYTALLVACLPLQLGALATGVWIVTRVPLSPLGFVGWTLSFGIASAVVAITVAHELIHRQSRWLQRIGGALLATVAYGSFKIEHVLGHHVHVATPQDPSTARRGDNVYAFVLRALYTNVPRAIALERAHAERSKRPHGFFSSEIARWTALTVALTAAAGAFGWKGALFFVGQALLAIVMLEVINFVEHYGLERKRSGRGYEVTTPAHSWNSSHLLSNLILFQLQRHSDHHANAARPYQVLRALEVSPELPAGYPTMVLLALVPPLYRAVLEPRLAALAPRS